MKLKMSIITMDERCDICDKIDGTRPMLTLRAPGAYRGDVQHVWAHLDEFEAMLARTKAKLAREQANTVIGQYGKNRP